MEEKNAKARGRDGRTRMTRERKVAANVTATDFAKAERIVARLVDCLEGIASEQGCDYLERFAENAERLVGEEAADVRQLLHDLANA